MKFETILQAMMNADYLVEKDWMDDFHHNREKRDQQCTKFRARLLAMYEEQRKVAGLAEALYYKMADDFRAMKDRAEKAEAELAKVEEGWRRTLTELADKTAKYKKECRIHDRIIENSERLAAENAQLLAELKEMKEQNHLNDQFDEDIRKLLHFLKSVGNS